MLILYLGSQGRFGDKRRRRRIPLPVGVAELGAVRPDRVREGLQAAAGVRPVPLSHQPQPLSRTAQESSGH